MRSVRAGILVSLDGAEGILLRRMRIASAPRLDDSLYDDSHYPSCSPHDRRGAIAKPSRGLAIIGLVPAALACTCKVGHS